MFLVGQNGKKIYEEKNQDDPAELLGKIWAFKTKILKNNEMFMKLSHKLLQNIKNTRKESCNNTLEIKEEKSNQSSTGLALLNNDNKAIIYQDAINENKDYFHSFVDDYGEDIIRYTVRQEKVNAQDYSCNIFFVLQEQECLNEENRGILFQWLAKKIIDGFK